MQTLFLVIYLAGLAHVALARRRFDLHAVAYVAACVYFLPGLYGYTLYPVGLARQAVPLADTTYAVMAFVLASIACGMLVVDRFGGGRGPRIVLRHAEWVTPTVLALAACGFALTVATARDALLLADKALMMDSLNRGHILWVAAATVALALAFAERRHRLAGAATLLLLADFYIGFRSALAMALIALALLHLTDRPQERFLFAHFRIVALGAVAGLAFFVYKPLYVAIKLGRLDLLASRIGGGNLVNEAIGTSEPFTTQALLDAVVRTGLKAPADHFTSIVQQAIVFAPALGARSQTFNELVQPELFPERIAGMASNVWAEMYATGGWLLLGAFALLFNVVLAVSSRLVRAADPRLRALVAVAAGSWAFYIHRNDLSYQINLEKRLALVFLAAWVVSSGVLIAVRAWSGRGAGGGAEIPTGESHAAP